MLIYFFVTNYYIKKYLSSQIFDESPELQTPTVY